MKTQMMAPTVERRQHQRGQGAVTEIENLTYNVLRKYGISGPAEELNSGQLSGKAA
jgi:hypothetical protein